MNLVKFFNYIATMPLVFALSIYDVCEQEELHNVDARVQEKLLSCEQSFAQNASLDYHVPQNWTALDLHLFTGLLEGLEEVIRYVIRNPESLSENGGASIARSWKSKHLSTLGKILMYLLKMELKSDGQLKGPALRKISPSVPAHRIRFMMVRSHFSALQKSLASILRLNAENFIPSEEEKHWMELLHRVLTLSQLIGDLVDRGLKFNARIRTHDAIAGLDEEGFSWFMDHLEVGFKSLQDLFKELGEAAKNIAGGNFGDARYSYENFDFSWVTRPPFVATFTACLEGYYLPDGSSFRLIAVGGQIDRFNAFLKLEGLRLQFALTKVYIDQLANSKSRGPGVYHKSKLRFQNMQFSVMSARLSTSVERLRQTLEAAKDAEAFNSAINITKGDFCGMVELLLLLQNVSKLVRSQTKQLVRYFRIHELSDKVSKTASKIAKDSAAALAPTLTSIHQILELSRQQLSDSELNRFIIMFFGLDSLFSFLATAKTLFDAVNSDAYNFDNLLPFGFLPAVIDEVEDIQIANLETSDDEAQVQSPQIEE